MSFFSFAISDLRIAIELQKNGREPPTSEVQKCWREEIDEGMCVLA